MLFCSGPYKFEFGINEIYGLQCNSSSRELEAELKTELFKCQLHKIRLQNFVEVMSKVECIDTQCVNNYRSNKRTRGQVYNINKKQRRMDTSTPIHMGSYRYTEIIPDETSPIVELHQEHSVELADKIGLLLCHSHIMLRLRLKPRLKLG